MGTAEKSFQVNKIKLFICKLRSTQATCDMRKEIKVAGRLASVPREENGRMMICGAGRFCTCDLQRHIDIILPAGDPIDLMYVV